MMNTKEIVVKCNERKTGTALKTRMRALPGGVRETIMSFVSNQVGGRSWLSTRKALQDYVNLIEFDDMVQSVTYGGVRSLPIDEPLPYASYAHCLNFFRRSSLSENVFFRYAVSRMWKLSEQEVRCAFAYVDWRKLTSLDWQTPTTMLVAARNCYVDEEDSNLIITKPEQFIDMKTVASTNSLQGKRQLFRTAECKQILLFALKAELFSRILCGKLVMAFNQTALIERHYSLWVSAFQGFEMFMKAVAWVGSVMMLAPIMIAQRISNQAQALAELSILLLSLWLLLKSCKIVTYLVAGSFKFFFKTYVLKSVKAEKETKYVAKRLTEYGITHEIMVDGKLIVLPESTVETHIRQDEMALPGSTLYPSKAKNVGAILVAIEGCELQVVGCFFRIGDDMFTAGHVASSISTSIARVFIAGIHNPRKDLHSVNLSKLHELDCEFFDLENSDVQSRYDLFVRELPSRVWSKIEVSSCSTKKKSFYGQNVIANGFVGPDGLFMASSGKTLKESGPEELWHSATTQKGFSGSPLFSGNSVVGMHISAAGDKNVALRIELIKWLYSGGHEAHLEDECAVKDRIENESNMPDITVTKHDVKINGRSVMRRDLDDGRYSVYMDANGEVDFGYLTDQLQALKYMAEHHGPKYEQAYDDFIEHIENDENITGKQFNKLQRIIDESNIQFGTVEVAQVTPEMEGFNRLPKKAPVHCSGSSKTNPEVVEFVEKKMDALTKQGYDPKKYVMPVATAETESVSVKKHLKLFNDRTKTVVKPPTSEEIRKTISIVAEMMKNNKFEPTINYRTIENVVSIIDSTAVKDSKSPGHPYQAQGLPTNQKVLERYTKEGLAELVLREWDSDDVELKCFIKTEPTKVEKIEREMPRIVTGMPLHKMIKNHAVFDSFAASLVENWQKSPIVYSFAPSKPGHIKHLASLFEGKLVAESDKSNWDINFFKYLFEIVEGVVLELSERPADMSEGEFEQWQADVKSSFAEVLNASFRCSNGDIYKSLEEGIMKSGWFLTIAANSIGQIALHVLVMLRMNYSSDEILSEIFRIVAGGDDVLQTFPTEFDIEKYRDTTRDLGFEVSDFKVHKSFDGCEFFSHVLKRENGVWTYHPTRFTKHIVNLMHTKTDDLANALSCHMLNHVWNSKKYNILDAMYREFRKTNPDQFPLALLKKQQALQYKVLGLE